MDNNRIKLQRKDIISFILIICLVLTIPMLAGTDQVHAVQKNDKKVTLNTVHEASADDDITIKVIGKNKAQVASIKNGLYDVTEMDLNSDFLRITGGGPTKITVDGDGTKTDYPIKIELNGVSISNNSDSPFKIINGADVELTLKNSNTLSSYHEEKAGLNVSQDSSIVMLGSGSLEAWASGGGNQETGGAGIGGNHLESYGKISIMGNTTVIASSANQAGIGGGFRGNGTEITIAGNARVKANGGNQGAGIGGGGGSVPAPEIYITESAIVSATSGMHGAGIGGGDHGNAPIISIGGDAFVTAKAGSDGSPDDIGSGNNASAPSSVFIKGGSVFAHYDRIAKCAGGAGPLDEYNNPVYKVTVPTLGAVNTPLIGNLGVTSGTYSAKTISSGACEHGDDFPTKSATAYVYLPPGLQKAQVGDVDDAYAYVTNSATNPKCNILLWHGLDEDKNIITSTAVDVKYNDKITFTAIGHKQDEAPELMAFRYLPKEWSFGDESGKFSNNSYEKTLTLTDTNNDEFIVTYSLQVYSGSKWEDTGEIDTKSLKLNISTKNVDVSLNPTGGKVSPEKVTIPWKSPKTTYGTLPEPTRKGYSFLGWFTKETGGTKVEASTPVLQDSAHTLYAQWKVNKYKVTFKANGKKVKKLKPKSKKVTYGSKYGKLPKPTKKGYKFKGWYTKAKGGTKITASSKMKYAKNTKLYAHWSKNPVVTNCKSAYLRKGPGVSYKIIGHVKNGNTITVIKKVVNGSGNLWYKVKVGQKTGYVYSEYIKK